MLGEHKSEIYKLIWRFYIIFNISNTVVTDRPDSMDIIDESKFVRLNTTGEVR